MGERGRKRERERHSCRRTRIFLIAIAHSRNDCELHCIAKKKGDGGS